MKIILDKIDFNPIDATDKSSNEKQFLDGKIKVHYIAVIGFNTWKGKRKLEKNTDLEEVKSKIKSEVEQELESGDYMPEIISCDWIKCKHNSYSPGDKNAGKCTIEKSIKLSVANKNSDKMICNSYESR